MFGPLPIRIMAGIVFIVARLPKLENISVNQGFFGSLGLPPELVLPIALLEVIGGVFLIVGVLTRITAAIFVIEMIGATHSLVISRFCRRTTTQTSCNINKFAINGDKYKSIINRSGQNIY
jgi:uncharacterized membrane protein YphA (DoxX/SURF4 family)